LVFELEYHEGILSYEEKSLKKIEKTYFKKGKKYQSKS